MENNAWLDYYDGLHLDGKRVKDVDGNYINHFSMPIDKDGEGRITIMVAKSEGGYTAVTIHNHKNGATVVADDCDLDRLEVINLENREEVA
jgi:hypothetical protein